MTTELILEYLTVQFPATIGHIPLKNMLVELEDQTVWCFSEDEIPIYIQGRKGQHEICSPVTAEDVTHLVELIVAQKSAMKELISFTADDLLPSRRARAEELRKKFQIA